MKHVKLIGISILVVISFLVVACASPTPQVIEKEVIVTQEVEVEKEVVVVATPEPEAVEEETLELRTPGVLTLGYNPVPGVVVVEDGEPLGVFADIFEEVAKRLDLETEWQVYDFAALIPALQSGRIDMIGTGFSQTQHRAQIFYYATPQFLQPEIIAVRPGSELTSWEEVAQRGGTLSTLVGYFYIGIWEEMGINIHTFDTDDACYLDVLEGDSEGCETGAFGALYKRANAPDSAAAQLQLNTVSGPQIVADLNAAALAKTSPVLAREVSEVLTDLWRDGTIEEAYVKVFGQEDAEFFMTPPSGHAFYMPGPWEKGVYPPPSSIYPEVSTISPGQLTIGVDQDSPLLNVDGSGPEGAVLSFVAQKMGLQPTFIEVDDVAGALNSDSIDIAAGALAATEEGSCQYWQSMPIGFNPDYIYVMPGDGGGYPEWSSWEDVTAAGGALAVVSGNPRIADLVASGADVIEVDTPIAGLQAVVDGSALGFVGSSIDYIVAASSNQEIADAGIGFVRNVNLYTYGEPYVWAVKSGNGELLDVLDQGINAAWQEDVLAKSFQDAFPGANVSAILAPGPAAVGTAYGASKDYTMQGMWITGPWLQRPGWCK